MPNVNIILGPPGTGKTENLLRIVDRELKNGTPPDRIAFVSFTTIYKTIGWLNYHMVGSNSEGGWRDEI